MMAGDFEGATPEALGRALLRPTALKVIAGSPDKPLHIGDVEVPCYVLQGEIRVLSQGGFLEAIGRSRTPPGRVDVDKTPFFLSSTNLKPFISNDLLMATKPLRFRAPRSGRIVTGYQAILLPEVCKVYLEARDAGALHVSQAHIAARAEVLIRGLAHVGIIGLVDEATGYQAIRDRMALHRILDQFLLTERAKWSKRFPDAFYMEIFRLRGWEWKGMEVNRPQAVAHYTNDLVWDRLQPGIRDELERLNPIIRGQRENRHHQWLTEDIGHPALQQHLIGLIAIMKSVRTEHGWDECVRSIQRAYPKTGETPSLLM